MRSYQMVIDGKSVDAADGTSFESLNPYTGKPWATVPRGGAEDASRAIRAAHQALKGPWGKLKPSARGALLHRLGDLIAANAERLAETEVRDNGKLLAEMLAQMRYMPQWFYYYGGLADKIEGTVIPTDKDDVFNFTRREPVGVVAAIVPWNSPLILTTYKMAPALAAGCTMVIKPSEFTSASMIEFMALVEEAGFPPGVINVVTGFGGEIGSALVEHPLVAKVAFTGSDATGQRIYESAAKNLKRVTLELGGKSANIVFADAEIDNAVNGAIAGIFAAAGQTCIAGSRLLVQRGVHDRVVDALLEKTRAIRMGDPMDPGTQLGPMATQPQLQKVLDYVEVGRKDGAQLAIGGGRPGGDLGNGWFVEPAIFTGVNNSMRIAREEVFGPVLSIIPFDTEEEALAIANDSPYGLASGVWTQDMRRILRMSAGLEAGTVWVNTYRAGSYMSPFGGYKRSGIGHENGIRAVDEYLHTKSVWISTALEVSNPFVVR